MGVVKLSREYVEQGFTYAEMRRQGRAGELERVRRGAWSAPVGDLDPRAAHLRLIEGTVRQSSPDAVVSHMSAAAMLGLPIFADALDQVSLTRNRRGGGVSRRYVRVHGSRLPAADVTERDGIRVTTPARTVVDLACTIPPFRSVPIGDAVLHQGIERTSIEAALFRAGRREGVGNARRVIAMLDGRSQSVGESSSRVVFRDNAIPDPEPQYEINGPDGFIAWVDFAWPEFRTVGEFDGKIKYNELVPEGKTAADVLFDEKMREDRLRALGWQVVRWVWAELFRPLALLRRLNAAFVRGLAG